jgi:formyl-CoA transferase
MGQPQLAADPRFATNADRVKNDAPLRDLVQAWVERHDRDDVFEILQEAEVPVGKLYTGKDIAEDEHFRERGSVVEYNSTRVGPMKVPSAPFRISGYDGPDFDEPPLAGEHTEQVLEELGGYSLKEITALRHAGAIG